MKVGVSRLVKRLGHPINGPDINGLRPNPDRHPSGISQQLR